MSDMKYEKIMDILEDERMKELACARKTFWLMKKTLNPFKRIRIKKGYDMFMNHVFGIDMAMKRIKREFEP